MKIREAKKKDVEDYKKLREESMKDYSKLAGEKMTLNEDLRKEFLQLISKNNLILMLELKKNIIGFISGNFNSANKSSYISDIFIEKEFRKKGYATKLLKEFIRIAKEKGIKKVRLGVRKNNIKAIKIYKKIGFDIAHYEMERII